MTPITEDFGEGYMTFCPVCLTCLGWEADHVKKCPACGCDLEELK